MNKKGCPFCKIVNREISASIVYESDKVICFLPKEIEVYGHTLVAPKEHFEDLYDIPNEILGELIRICKKLSLAYKDRINATGINLMHASGKDGQQSVPHFHIHLLPRFRNDNLDTWPKLPKINIDREELLSKLKID
jgi:histidine triad (HIT) family protein